MKEMMIGIAFVAGFGLGTLYWAANIMNIAAAAQLWNAIF